MKVPNHRIRSAQLGVSLSRLQNEGSQPGKDVDLVKHKSIKATE